MNFSFVEGVNFETPRVCNTFTILDYNKIIKYFVKRTKKGENEKKKNKQKNK